jgi:hypothetical protein
MNMSAMISCRRLPIADSRIPINSAEAAAAGGTIFIAITIEFAYLSDSIGFPIVAWLVFLVAFAAAAGTFRWLRRFAARERDAAAICAAIVATAFAWLLWLARPELLPTGSGPDLVHHLALIAYIEQHWRLVHDLRLSEYLGEMIDYTPGVHLLTALGGAWLRTGGLHALDAVMALTVAIKAGFVFLIARRLVPTERTRNAFAVLAVVLLLVPYAYSVGSFTEQSYLAQVASELFAAAMWWTLTVWDEQPSRGVAALFAVFGVGAFLTWPVWTGPLLLVLAGVALLHGERRVGDRAVDLAVAVAPIALIAALHGARHPGGFRMVGTGGFAVWPTTAVVRPWFYAVAAMAIVFAARQRRTRVVIMLLLAIALQAAALTRTARASGAETPYLALKMFYLAIYPAVVAIAVMAAALWRIATMRVPRLRTAAAAWVVVAAIAVAVARPLAAAPRPTPIVSNDVLRAAEWAKNHASPACIDYLTRSGYTAYWLHLAVFGQPRASGRAMDDATFEPKQAVVRWILPGSLEYAITDDLDALPRDVRDNVDVVAQFGKAAVVRRHGRSMKCP